MSPLLSRLQFVLTDLTDTAHSFSGDFTSALRARMCVYSTVKWGIRTNIDVVVQCLSPVVVVPKRTIPQNDY